MSLSKHQQKVRFSLLNMALSIRGGQEVPVHELIADANALNDWVIGVDYAAAGSSDESHSSLEKLKHTKVVSVSMIGHKFALAEIAVYSNGSLVRYEYLRCFSDMNMASMQSKVVEMTPDLVILGQRCFQHQLPNLVCVECKNLGRPPFAKMERDTFSTIGCMALDKLISLVSIGTIKGYERDLVVLSSELSEIKGKNMGLGDKISIKLNQDNISERSYIHAKLLRPLCIDNVLDTVVASAVD